MNTDPETATTGDSITAQYRAIAAAVCARLEKNERVRRNLPGGGRLRMDRQLPFLLLYRGSDDGQDSGTQELITTEAAYLFTSQDQKHHVGLSHLCGAISSTMQEHFGVFLLLEIAARSGDALHGPQLLGLKRLNFEIESSDADAMSSTVAALKTALETITVGRRSATVTITDDATRDTNRLPSLDLACSHHCGINCMTLRLSVSPIYRDPATGAVFPMVLQSLRFKLATVIRKAIAEFIGNTSPQAKAHYQSLGPSMLVKAARLIDQQLCEVSESFDFLLQVTPTNATEAWECFQESGFRELPPLQYRYLPYHPNLLKRRLFAIEIERVEDPTMAHLYWEKQAELDRQLTSLRDIDSLDSTITENRQQSNFLLSSFQLYGATDLELVELAQAILKKIARRNRKNSKQSSARGRCLSASELVTHAHEEIDYYRSQMTEFNATVELSDSIAAGIMVSQHRLMIANGLKVPQRRVAALLHHEIGTHLLTYFNGRCQPFRQMYAGLAGHEELQEGLAVLGEYLVGGLTSKRMRTLASRVMAVHWMCEGQSFASVFAKLNENYEISKSESFKTTLRVFRGGGLTKDAIYLRGLCDLLAYLALGHDIEPLYVGKIGLQHVPYIQELRRRGIIMPPRILPRFLDDPNVRQRLEACRAKSVLDLIE